MMKSISDLLGGSKSVEPTNSKSEKINTLDDQLDENNIENKDNKIERMDGNWIAAHGRAGNSDWPMPRLVVKSDKSVRPDQNNDMAANEYLDEFFVLDEKIDLLLELLLASKYCTAYTGAGLSKSAGIPDYATQAANSIAKFKKVQNVGLARPTLAHRVLTALERKKILKYWIQQNHDGLPQKAGYPEWKMNSIHGDWFDISNPVVQFSGSLRSDLFDDMLKKERRTDLCLCLGTSLSGMNADRMATTPAKDCDLPRPKSRCAMSKDSLKNANTLGTVIVNLQRTYLDKKSSLRIWAKLDDVFERLAQKMNMKVEDYAPLEMPIALPKTEIEMVFPLPRYNAMTGERLKDSEPDSDFVIDLREGKKIVVIHPDACNKGRQAVVQCCDPEGNFNFLLKEVGKLPRRYTLGRWWIPAAMNAKVKRFPIANIE